MQSGLQGLLAVIKHHHSLGLVHDDISLGSITLVDEKLIFINFVNCRWIGQSLRYTDTKKNTTGLIILLRLCSKNNLISMLLKSYKSGSLAWLLPIFFLSKLLVR